MIPQTKHPCLIVLFALSAAQIASAYYCPSDGRWLSRDPIGEPGFENLRAAGVVPGVGQVTSSASLSPGRWINRDPMEGKYLYAFVANAPENNIDRLGLDVVNNSDESAWVYSSDGPNAGWKEIKPGDTVTRDTDMICPNVKGAVKGSDGKYHCLKIIDCYDANITGNAPGPYSITPVYAGATAGRGNNLPRKCCCAIPRCASVEQNRKGGSKNPLEVAPSLPPDYPP